MRKNAFLVIAIISVLTILALNGNVLAQTFSGNGSVGLKGVVPGSAPTDAPRISIPGNGSSSRSNPNTVSGFCTDDLLVKVFKNGVFGGSAQCNSGSFSMSLDLFEGTNELTAKQYDLLDQESPQSTPVTVNFTAASPSSAARDLLSLTSNFAKRGANPRETVTWPIIISGGQGPYAVTVDWGDGNNSVQSIVAAGEFTIEHSYTNPGAYTVVVKAVDVNGKAAFLQLVAISNGSLSQTAGTNPDGSSSDTTSGGADSEPKTRILWQPAAIMIPFIISTFWLGKRYAIHRLRKKIEAGERPFSY